MPIVNGHQADTGCWIDGHWGQYGPDRLAEIAEGFGWTPTPDNDPRHWRTIFEDEFREEGTRFEASDNGIESADDIETWLNDHTPPVCRNCGREVGDNTLCTARTPERGFHELRSFLWHWRDGEFFLSPICENGDCDDDTCAHWD